MKILVTGATGLIGKYLVRKLKENGHEMDVRMNMKMNSTSSNRVIPAAFLLAPLGLLFGCGTPAAPPLGLSLVRIPEQVFADPPDNVSTPERVELGRSLIPKGDF